MLEYNIPGPIEFIVADTEEPFHKANGNGMDQAVRRARTLSRRAPMHNTTSRGTKALAVVGHALFYFILPGQ